MLLTDTLVNREKSHHGIYSDIGHILDKYSTDELFRYVKDNLSMDTALRYYLEQNIVAYIKTIESK